MHLLKKGMTLSIVGITILVLSFSFWNDRRLEALANNDDWSSSYSYDTYVGTRLHVLSVKDNNNQTTIVDKNMTVLDIDNNLLELQDDNNNIYSYDKTKLDYIIIIDQNRFDYITQGQGVVESVYMPIKSAYDRVVNIYHKIGSFFGIVDLSDTLQANETYYGTLKDVYLQWTLYDEQGAGYQFSIDVSTALFYAPDDGFYYEETYTTLLGIRLWRTNTKVLTYEELDLYNDQYLWV